MQAWRHSDRIERPRDQAPTWPEGLPQIERKPRHRRRQRQSATPTNGTRPNHRACPTSSPTCWPWWSPDASRDHRGGLPTRALRRAWLTGRPVPLIHQRTSCASRRPACRQGQGRRMGDLCRGSVAVSSGSQHTAYGMASMGQTPRCSCCPWQSWRCSAQRSPATGYAYRVQKLFGWPPGRSGSSCAGRPWWLAPTSFSSSAACRSGCDGLQPTPDNAPRWAVSVRLDRRHRLVPGLVADLARCLRCASAPLRARHRPARSSCNAGEVARPRRAGRPVSGDAGRSAARAGSGVDKKKRFPEVEP